MTELKVVFRLPDYELIDFGDGEKLERWSNLIVRRFNAQAISKKSNLDLWDKADLVYLKNNANYKQSNNQNNKNRWGNWLINTNKDINNLWFRYKKYQFKIAFSEFKHTGIFPEQAINWDWIESQNFKNINRHLKALNLFGYTGTTTAVLINNGFEVTHVDSVKKNLNFTKINIIESGLDISQIRLIRDDVLKFVKREIKRGNKYNAFVIDPPEFGFGKDSKWDIKHNIVNLLESIVCLIDNKKPVFLILNLYSLKIHPIAIFELANGIFKNTFKFSNHITLGIKSAGNKRLITGDTILLYN